MSRPKRPSYEPLPFCWLQQGEAHARRLWVAEEGVARDEMGVARVVGFCEFEGGKIGCGAGNVVRALRVHGSALDLSVVGVYDGLIKKGH